MDDLVAFLRARLDDDAVSDKPAGEPSDWCDRNSGVHLEPGRMTAEAETKRRILEEIVPKVRQLEDKIEDEWGAGDHAGYEESEDLVRLLALPYASHPDYREEWRP